jgi:hypothetical protein
MDNTKITEVGAMVKIYEKNEKTKKNSQTGYKTIQQLVLALVVLVAVTAAVVAIGRYAPNSDSWVSNACLQIMADRHRPAGR